MLIFILVENKIHIICRDHEYEPISPPDEMTVNVAVVDEGNDPKVIISAVDILDEPVEEKKKSFFQVQVWLFQFKSIQISQKQNFF